MTYDPEKHHRRSIHLKGYDYAQPGAYFVTVCVRERECVLGNTVNGKMVLSDFGQVAHDFWAQVPAHFPNASIDTFVVMPNHVHVVIIINDPNGTDPVAASACRGAVSVPAPEDAETKGVETTPLPKRLPEAMNESERQIDRKRSKSVSRCSFTGS
jgi:hypothetical protein